MGSSSSTTAIEELPPEHDPSDSTEAATNQQEESDPSTHFMQAIPAFVARPEPVPKMEWPPPVKSRVSDAHEQRILAAKRRVQSMSHSKPDVSNAGSHIQVRELKDALDPELHSQFLHKRPGWKKFSEEAKKGSKELHERVAADAKEHGVDLEEPESVDREQVLARKKTRSNDQEGVANYFRGTESSDEDIADPDDFTEQDGQDALDALNASKKDHEEDTTDRIDIIPND